MIKNTAGQKIGAQMVSASDGSAFTGAVTVYVTGDAGTQAIGSVGAGACTHEGNGYHTYSPAQAETNCDLIGFTFIGTGAIPATVQVYTKAGDAFTRLGAPAGASVSADIAAIKAETSSIQADTNDIQTRIPAALVSGRIDASVGAMATDVITSTALATSAVTEIQSGLSTLDAAGVRTAIGLASANLDTQLTAIDDYLDTEVAAIKAKTDNLPTDPADASVVAGLIAAVETKVDAVDTVVDAIKAKTDNLTFTVAGQVDSNVTYVNDVEVIGNGETGTEWGPA